MLARKAKLLNYIYFYRIGDGNQGAHSAERPLEPHGAPSILQFPQSLN
ncbi:hypothetical protein PESP_b0124 [Pseudoalteromonas espejiana DSM 9414]|nr:hypothetical protein PESP_b0124 [Pseudoalteromonas espejiana DSM 9414]